MQSSTVETYLLKGCHPSFPKNCLNLDAPLQWRIFYAVNQKTGDYHNHRFISTDKNTRPFFDEHNSICDFRKIKFRRMRHMMKKFTYHKNKEKANIRTFRTKEHRTQRF